MVRPGASRPDQLHDVAAALEPVAVAVADPEHRARDPDVGGEAAERKAVKRLGRHADDGEGVPVEVHLDQPTMAGSAANRLRQSS